MVHFALNRSLSWQSSGLKYCALHHSIIYRRGLEGARDFITLSPFSWNLISLLEEVMSGLLCSPPQSVLLKIQGVSFSLPLRIQVALTLICPTNKVKSEWTYCALQCVLQSSTFRANVCLSESISPDYWSVLQRTRNKLLYSTTSVCPTLVVWRELVTISQNLWHPNIDLFY